MKTNYAPNTLEAISLLETSEEIVKNAEVLLSMYPSLRGDYTAGISSLHDFSSSMMQLLLYILDCGQEFTERLKDLDYLEK